MNYQSQQGTPLPEASLAKPNLARVILRCWKMLKPKDMAVYTAIYEAANGQFCDAYQEELAVAAGMSVRHLRRAIAHLQELELIEVQTFFNPAAHQTKNRYILLFLADERPDNMESHRSEERPDNMESHRSEERPDNMESDRLEEQPDNMESYRSEQPDSMLSDQSGERSDNMESAMMIHDDVYIGKRKEILQLLDFLHAGERLKRAKQKHVTVAYAQQWRAWWERADFGNLTNPAGFANEAIRQGHAPPQQRHLPDGVLFASEDFVWSPPEVAALPDQDTQAWSTTLAHQEGQMTKATFDTWLRGTAPLGREEETLIIGVKCNQAKEWLDNRLHQIISRAAAAQGLGPIRFEVRAAADSEIHQEIEL